ncbi:hypothetical protein J6590_037563 [Homalodisca vitripennis]|nr:hypothetical protein J6590_097415 [Homalodisca vitripennis]KAG8297339.1 hypothetical protein J6590_037563 [Homalodisca vitripennis]
MVLRFWVKQVLLQLRRELRFFILTHHLYSDITNEENQLRVRSQESLPPPNDSSDEFLRGAEAISEKQFCSLAFLPFHVLYLTNERTTQRSG